MTEQLARSHADLEQRIVERTRDLEAMRDLLDAFFQIFTSRLDPQNIERTFDSVLRFCHQLGYDLAMISLVDREAGVIRGVRGAGTMADVVAATVRPLEGDDILAVVVREGQPVVIGDSATDPRCDQAAVARSRIRGQIILPLVGDSVLGTLQVATPRSSSGSRRSSPARIPGQSHRPGTRRPEPGGGDSPAQPQPGAAGPRTGQVGGGPAGTDPDLATGARLHARGGRRGGSAGRTWWCSTRPPSGFWAGTPVLLPASAGTPCTRCTGPTASRRTPPKTCPCIRAIRGESLDHAELYIAHPSLQDGSWMLVNARPLRDDQGEIQGGMVVFHDITPRKNNERRLAVQYAATRVLSEVDSLTEAIPLILEIVGQRLDWDFGAFWRLEHGGHQLRCVAVWHGPGIEFPSFEEMTRRIASAPDSGLPGRVWSTRKSDWVNELSEESGFPRWTAAARMACGRGLPFRSWCAASVRECSSFSAARRAARSGPARDDDQPGDTRSASSLIATRCTPASSSPRNSPRSAC